MALLLNPRSNLIVFSVDSLGFSIRLLYRLQTQMVFPLLFLLFLSIASFLGLTHWDIQHDDGQ